MKYVQQSTKRWLIKITQQYITLERSGTNGWCLMVVLIDIINNEKNDKLGEGWGTTTTYTTYTTAQVWVVWIFLTLLYRIHQSLFEMMGVYSMI